MRSDARWRIFAGIAVPLALLVALLTWAVSSPPGSSPDDDYHMASIWCAEGEVAGQCETTAVSDERVVPAELVLVADCYRFQPAQAFTCPIPVGETAATERGNWADGSYPPLFYRAMSAFIGDDWSTSILVMRAANATLYVGLLTLLYFLLPVLQRRVLLWSVGITLVPLGMFIIPSVNPSSWAVLSGTGLWLAAWGYFRQSGWRKWALAGAAALLLVLGAGARGDAAVFGVLGLIVASVLAFRRERRYLLDLLLPVGLAAVAVVMFLSTGHSDALSEEAAVEPQQSFWTLLFANLIRLPTLWIDAFASQLGWMDTATPGLVWVSAALIFGALVFWGLQADAPGKRLAMLGTAFALVVAPLYIAVQQSVVLPAYVQPRYIYPVLIMFGGLALIGFRRADLGLRRVHLVIIGAGLAAAASMGLHANMRRYITGLDLVHFNLNTAIEWWWNSPVLPMTVWAIGSAASTVVVALLIASAWRSPRGTAALAASAASAAASATTTDEQPKAPTEPPAR